MVLPRRLMIFIPSRVSNCNKSGAVFGCSAANRALPTLLPLEIAYMMQREFGADKTAWPVLGLGCSRIGSLGNPVPMRDIRALLERSLDLGVNLLDTADIYGQGDSEREIGRLLAGRRDRAFVVTKVGKLFSRKMRLMRPLKPLLKPLLAKVRSAKGAVVGQRDANLATDFSPEHITAAAED